MPTHNTALIYSSQQQQKEPEANRTRVKLTARITLAAYDAIAEMQRRHRRETGKALRLWEVLNAAVVDYAKQQGIEVRK